MGTDLKKVCVDYDGVLNMYDGWKGDGIHPEPREGVENFLKKLSESFDVVIHTTRPQNEVATWLCKYDLAKFVSTITATKVPAVAYIDDRGINFDGSFDKVLDLLLSIGGFAAHWEQTGTLALAVKAVEEAREIIQDVQEENAKPAQPEVFESHQPIVVEDNTTVHGLEVKPLTDEEIANLSSTTAIEEASKNCDITEFPEADGLPAKCDEGDESLHEGETSLSNEQTTTVEVGQALYADMIGQVPEPTDEDEQQPTGEFVQPIKPEEGQIPDPDAE